MGRFQLVDSEAAIFWEYSCDIDKRDIYVIWHLRSTVLELCSFYMPLEQLKFCEWNTRQERFHVPREMSPGTLSDRSDFSASKDARCLK